VEEVAGDQGLPAAGLDRDADVTRRVARRRDESDLGREPVAHVDELEQAGIEDQLHRVGQDRPGLRIAIGLPVGDSCRPIR
jgi:hypothetical protein